MNDPRRPDQREPAVAPGLAAGFGTDFFRRVVIVGTAGSGLFVYSPTQGPGNLVGSFTGTAGVDPFGNSYPAGLSVTQGVIAGVVIKAMAETINPGPFILDSPAGLTITPFTATGVNNWTAPAAVTSVQAYVWGAGGGGDGSDAANPEGGGGGGAFSYVGNVAVTPATVYHPFVGTGGAANTAGTASTFAGDVVTVTGNGGGGATDPGFGTGGAASTLPAGVVSFAGGPGAEGGGNPSGGGGGGAAGNLSAGGAGQAGTAGAGGLGGAAGASTLFASGAGGQGSLTGVGASNGVAPGGGGGGGGRNGAAGAGANGQVILVYSTGALSTVAVIAGAAGTDPATGTAFSRGITSIDPVFGDTLRIDGGNIYLAGGTTVKLNTGNFDVATIGDGFQVAEGSNAKQNRAGPLVAGTLTVANTSVTANSRILVTGSPGGANRGGLNVTTITAGVSFVVTSTNAADTGFFTYEIFEPG